MKVIKSIIIILLLFFGCVIEQSNDRVDHLFQDTLVYEKIIIIEDYNEIEEIEEEFEIDTFERQLFKKRNHYLIIQLDTTSVLDELSNNLRIIEQQQKELDSILNHKQN